MSLSPADRTSGKPNAWTFVGLTLVLAGPFVLASDPLQGVYALAGDAAPFAGQLVFYCLVGLVLIVLHFGEGAPLGAIGLVRPRFGSVLSGVGLGVGVYVVLALIAVVLVGLGLFENKSASSEVLAWPLAWRIIVATAAGFAEEILYRGYAIERLTLLTGRRSFAAVLAVVAFAMAHVPFWGVAGVAVPLLGGVFFTLLYLWRRDLVICIAAHSTIDLIGVVLLPALAGRA